MSQLQIGLITLGALIILAVLLFNWWQERNIKREMFRRFDGPIDDVLMAELREQPAALRAEEEPVEEFRIDPEAVFEYQEQEVVMIEETITTAPEQQSAPEDEPAFSTVAPESDESQEPAPVIEETEASPEAEQQAGPQAEVQPAQIEEPESSSNMEDTPEPEVAEDVAPAREEAPAVQGNMPPATDAYTLPDNVDTQVDEIATIKLNSAAAGATIRDALQPLPAFQKPVRWIGENEAGRVLPLTRDHEQEQFIRVIAALQLADRSGPASGEDLRNFHAKVEDMATRVGGTLDWHEHGDPLQYARELDQFCIDVDVMISLQVVAGSGGPFAGTKLRGVAEAGGGVLKDDGQFHFSDENGETQFVLCSLDRKPMTAESLRTAMLRGVALLMDLPRVNHCTEVFNQMVLVGRKLETALASKLTDENQRTLGDAEIDKIRQQLKVLHSKMLARGIVPGSPSALRLFS